MVARLKHSVAMLQHRNAMFQSCNHFPPPFLTIFPLQIVQYGLFFSFKKLIAFLPRPPYDRATSVPHCSSSNFGMDIAIETVEAFILSKM
jgi:hypothetical protein